MRIVSVLSLLLCTAFGPVTLFAGPEVSFSGFLDSDVWTDLGGSFFTNQELDLGMTLAFSDAVGVNLYTTVLAGSVPAREGRPGERWASVLFDGLNVTWESGMGTFTVGDLVYQYGGFSYYFYKRLSMITPESFTRGMSFTFGNDRLEQTILLGAADDADELVSYRVTTTSDVTVDITGRETAAMSNGGDIVASTRLRFSDAQEMTLFYGLRGDIAMGWEETGRLFGGTEYNGSFGDVLTVKADIGYQNYGGTASTVALLAEPVLTLGDFSLAASYYQFFDPDETGANFIDDELYASIEPGYTFNKTLSFGLPLEVHTADGVSDSIEFADKSAFWAVPTIYLFPADQVEWWLWAQVVVPFSDAAGPGYGLGSEIIVEF